MKIIKLKNPPSITKYVQLVNGVFNLTNKEIEILSAFLELQKQFPDLYVFTSEMKKKVADKLSMDNFNVLNIYIKNFKDKKAISSKNGQYIFHTLLDVRNESNGIGFKWENNKNN